MDALMAALVAALLIHATDRTPWLMAGLGARYRQQALVVLGAVITLAIVNTLAATGGALIAPRLTPNARALFLAIALAAAGLGCFGKLKPPESMTGWRTGPLFTPLIGMLTLGFGSAQFLTMAIALRVGEPAFAAVGATIGGAVIVAAALALGEKGVAPLRQRVARLPVGGLLILAAIIAALSALRLI
ncbi:MAG: TMEM165/GDT1 family protein [Sphingomonas sp.]|nr:TMEM165/GDT1 family protein [Sphingomonas sp.]